MSWSILGNAILVLLLTLIGVAFVALIVEIVRDRSFERRLAWHERADSGGYADSGGAADGYGESFGGDAGGGGAD
jgi:uncharacterized membrane protein YgcG